MNKTSFPRGLLTAPLTLLIALATLHVPAVNSQGSEADTTTNAATTAASEAPATVDDAPAPVMKEEHAAGDKVFLKAIADIESSEGAYAGRLSESLLGLGLKLQSQGRHQEAIKVLRRGVHLARINEGLYCTQQIPLLQGEIESYKAVQDYAAADERQTYLYRVQTRALKSGAALTDAFMQQAKWHYDAYQLGLEEQGHQRLMAMMDQYKLAAQDVVAREGEGSPNLLGPLHGMLEAEYLIARHEVREESPVFTQDEQMPQIDESLLRFRGYRVKSFEQGNAIIQAISTIEKNSATPDDAALARTLVMLGDWRLWNGKTDAALEAYREAEAELARGGDVAAQELRLFGEPVALPDITGLNPLPPAVAPEEGNVTLTFNVSDSGRVQEVERLDTNEELDSEAYRLMKRLRKTTFRPRFEAGQPVETQKLVKAYHL